MSHYSCRPIDEIISSAYGTSLEKCFLLAALLNEAGFNAEPIIAFRTKAEQGLCRPAIEQTAIHCQWGNKSLLFSPDSYKRPNVDPEHQTLLSLTTGQPIKIQALQESRIEGDITINLLNEEPKVTGQYQIGNDLLPHFSDNTIQEEHVSIEQVADKFYILTLPEAPQGVATLGYGRLNSRRETNLLLPRIIDEHYTITIISQNDLEPQTPPCEKQIENNVGKLTIRINQEKDRVIVERQLTIPQRLITPKNYPDFHQLMTEWEDKASRSLVFKRK